MRCKDLYDCCLFICYIGLPMAVVVATIDLGPISWLNALTAIGISTVLVAKLRRRVLVPVKARIRS